MPARQETGLSAGQISAIMTKRFPGTGGGGEERLGVKRQRSLLVRLLAIVAVMILAPSVLTFLVFFRTVPRRMEAQAQANVGFYIGQTGASVKTSMELARDLALSAIGDSALQETMQHTETYLSAAGRGALERVVGGVTAYQSAWNRNALSGIYLFRDDGQYTFYSPRGAYVQEQRRMERIYAQSRDLTSARTLFQISGAPEGRVYYLLDYKNIDTLAHLGKLVMELNVSAMVSAGELMELYPGTCVILSGAEGEALYVRGEETEAMSGAISPGDSEEFLQLGSAGRRGRYYHVASRIPDYQLQMDVFVPAAAIYNQVWGTNLIFFVSCLLILFLTMGVAALGYCLVMRPLRDLETALGRMAASDYTARMPSSNYRELTVLEKAFNAMADNLDSAFHETYQKGIALQESESRLLAAQINPHFVFNVLETIHMRCVDAGMKDISRMVTDLAQLLRGNIGAGGGSQLITFAQELNYVRYYMELQQSRFGAENLRFSIDYEDEEILKCRVPRLTVQPLVENAVVHGLEPRRGLGCVLVRLWEEDSSVCVRVEDDGVGFDPDTLELSTEAETGRHNHIALPNIWRRLQLLYGSRASLTIRSHPGGGTQVMLMLPIEEEM